MLTLNGVMPNDLAGCRKGAGQANYAVARRSVLHQNCVVMFIWRHATAEERENRVARVGDLMHGARRDSDGISRSDWP